MDSWIYLFSKFTPELLVFQSAFVFVLIAAYAALWVLRRRRLGEEEITIKAGVVRNYLGLLISDAESMRRQLFAILQGEGMPAPHDLAAYGGGPSLGKFAGPTSFAPLPALKVDDPELQAKLIQLEQQMTQQAAALDGISKEKARLEQELAGARSAGGGAPAGTGAPGEDSKPLQDKINELEARLAEYSVIEDDLANLKRLQQENAQLKTQLSQAGAAAAVAAAIPATPTAPAPAEAAPVPAAPVPTPAVAAPVEPAAASPAAPPSAGGQSAIDDMFAAASTAFETSGAAEPEAASPPGEAAAAAPPTEAAAPAEAAGNLGSSDADLVAEFEKMLNG